MLLLIRAEEACRQAFDEVAAQARRTTIAYDGQVLVGKLEEE